MTPERIAEIRAMLEAVGRTDPFPWRCCRTDGSEAYVSDAHDFFVAEPHQASEEIGPFLADAPATIQELLDENERLREEVARRWPRLSVGQMESVVVSGSEVVILGIPPESDGDEEGGHNCDAMGCGQSHVLWRGRLARLQPCETCGSIESLDGTRESCVRCLRAELERRRALTYTRGDVLAELDGLRGRVGELDHVREVLKAPPHLFAAEAAGKLIAERDELRARCERLEEALRSAERTMEIDAASLDRIMDYAGKHPDDTWYALRQLPGVAEDLTVSAVSIQAVLGACRAQAGGEGDDA